MVKKATTGAAKSKAAPIPRREVKGSPAEAHAEGAARIAGITSPSGEDDSDKVTALVPKAFKIRKADHSEVSVQAGTQELPRWIVSHWWGVANGVEEYQSPSKASKE